MRLATAADITDEWTEVICGVLMPKEGASFKHGCLHGRLVSPLRDRHWMFAMSVGTEFEAHEIYLPDLVGYRRDRPDWAKLVAQSRDLITQVLPDFVCELLSPTTAARDLGVKFHTYERCRVQHYWIVDPMQDTLTVHRWTPDGYQVALSAHRDQVVHAEPFEVVALDLVDLFEELPPGPE